MVALGLLAAAWRSDAQGLMAQTLTAQAAGVDVALVLAVDSSSSVDLGEFALQMNGLAAAFRDPVVASAVRGGPSGRIAVLLVEWSNAGWQRVDIPWRTLSDAASLEAFARDLEDQARLIYGGQTAIGSAVDFSVRQFATLPAPARRKVIDVSADGRSNQGRRVDYARDGAVAAGVTINGLAIVNEEPDLAGYFEQSVIGGPGAFVIEAADYGAFADAMRRKLLRELGTPVAALP